MLIIPAIDLLDGHVVRLEQGLVSKSKVYGNCPVDTAKYFQDIGAERLHLVDLNGAMYGETDNFKFIEEITKNVSMDIEVGGGIRDLDKIKKYFDIGISYLILGTLAVRDPAFTIEILEHYPGKIILALDCLGENVAVEGWVKESQMTQLQFIDMYQHYNVESIIYTDISLDGTLKGLNNSNIEKLASNSPFPIIASGGVKDIHDIKMLETLKNIKGCIIGKAFYEGLINMEKIFMSR